MENLLEKTRTRAGRATMFSDIAFGVAEKEKDRKERVVQKFTHYGCVEAVLVGDLPFFLQINDSGEPMLLENIPYSDMVLVPPQKTAYPGLAYEFTDLNEIKSVIEKAKKETLDSLYTSNKSISKKYIHQKNYQLSILSADNIFTYFQDRLGQTHFLNLTGDNGTGKSNILTLLAYTGYRPLHGTSLNAANIYSALGSIEEGQCIILEDEADGIEDDREKMKIYKVGYTKGAKVSRIVSSSSKGRVMENYCAFGFKAFAAEVELDATKAKGLLERTLVMRCLHGSPQYDIAEVINPAGDRVHSGLLQELLEFRKLLLVHRLLHYNDIIPNIEIGLKGREKQLCKPLLRLFQKSACRTEISQALEKLLQEKRQAKSDTLEGRLFIVAKRLVSNVGQAPTIAVVFEAVRAELDGQMVKGKSDIFHCFDHGRVTLKQVTKIYREKFGATSFHTGKHRGLVFDLKVIEKLKSVYANDFENRIAIDIIP
jgi:hypothetical protein